MVQVAALKAEVGALHHDNTLLRNALARSQQESAEYSSCMSNMHNSAQTAATELQKAARVSAELEDAKGVNVRLQSRLDTCRQELAQAQARHQVWSIW